MAAPTIFISAVVTVASTKTVPFVHGITGTPDKVLVSVMKKVLNVGSDYVIASVDGTNVNITNNDAAQDIDVVVMAFLQADLASEADLTLLEAEIAAIHTRTAGEVCYVQSAPTGAPIPRRTAIFQSNVAAGVPNTVLFSTLTALGGAAPFLVQPCLVSVDTPLIQVALTPSAAAPTGVILTNLDGVNAVRCNVIVELLHTLTR